MVYSLMFLTSLAMALYAAALGIKLAVRFRNPLSRLVFALLVPAAAVLPGLAVMMVSKEICDPYLMLSCPPETGGITLVWLYEAAIAWTAATALGGLVILVAGFQNRGWTPASNEWHAEGLFLKAVIAMVLTVALFFAADNLVTRELKSELAWYQKLHEWTEPLPPEGGEEGRKAYIAAYTAMQNIFGTPEGMEGTQPEWWDDAFRPDSGFNAGSPEVRKFLWENKDVYSLIANAASAPALDMTLEDLNEYQPVNAGSMGRMLHLSARANAERGWFISSMRDIRNILKIERHHRDTMGLLGYILSMRLRNFALNALEDAVSNPGFYGTEPAHYPELNDVSSPKEFMSHLRRNHAEDVAAFLGALTAPAGEVEDQAEKLEKTVYRAFMARYALGCIRTAYAEEEESLAEGPASLDGLEDRLGDCKGYMSPYGLQYVEASFRATGSRGAELALATVKYYRRHQRYPSEIDALAPAFIESIPADPFGASGTMAMAEEDGALLFYSPAYENQKGQRVGFRLKKQ